MYLLIFLTIRPLVIPITVLIFSACNSSIMVHPIVQFIELKEHLGNNLHTLPTLATKVNKLYPIHSFIYTFIYLFILTPLSFALAEIHTPASRKQIHLPGLHSIHISQGNWKHNVKCESLVKGRGLFGEWGCPPAWGI